MTCSGWNMAWMWAVWVLSFWITLGILGVWAVKQWQATTTAKYSARTGDVLEERFARGEIDKEEFERRR